MEWTADHPNQLHVPDDVKATQRYRFSAPAPISLVGTCEEWVAPATGTVVLRNCLIDTSERFQGTVLKARVTHRTEMSIVNAPVVFVLINPEER